MMRMQKATERLLVLTMLLFASVTESTAQSAANVAVIINEASPISRRVGDHYIKVRRVPPENVIRLTTSDEERISLLDYQRNIEAPIAEALNRHGSHDSILYLVLTKGLPLRIEGTDGRRGTTSSVDSELTLLYRRLTGAAVPAAGPVPNPYFAGDGPIQSAVPFTHRRHDIFLVARLDGFTEEDAIGLIDRAQTASTTGRIALDQRATVAAPGERWLADAAAR